MEKLNFTLMLLDDQNIPFAVWELSTPELGSTKVSAFLPDELLAYEAAALLMIAATSVTENHQRVKLLAMIAEISARMDFIHAADFDHPKD